MDFGIIVDIKHQRRLCQILVRADLVAVGGGCGYGVTILTTEAAGNGRGGRVEGFGGGVQGERNGRHWDDHWLDNVHVSLYCLPPFPCPP